MKITDILAKHDRGVSFEFFPPKTEKGKTALRTTVSVLKQCRPLYVSMTCGAGGGTQKHTKEATGMLLGYKELVVMPHLTCIDASQDAIESLLDEYKESGVENIMALRGDPPQSSVNSGSPLKVFPYARNLVALTKRYGHFCIGVAVYPEGHIETSSLKQDMEYTKQKIDSGADFAVTQMFFDNTDYYGLLDRMEKNGITIPVLPGILPLTNIDKVKQFVSICRTTIPKHIEQALARFGGQPLEMEKAGVDFTIKQCRDLIDNGIKRLHFFTLNKPSVIKTILAAIQE